MSKTQPFIQFDKTVSPAFLTKMNKKIKTFGMLYKNYITLCSNLHKQIVYLHKKSRQKTLHKNKTTY